MGLTSMTVPMRGVHIEFMFGSPNCRDNLDAAVLWEGMFFTPEDEGAVIGVRESDLHDFRTAANLLTNGIPELICHKAQSENIEGQGPGTTAGGTIEYAVIGIAGSPWQVWPDFQGSEVTALELHIDHLRTGRFFWESGPANYLFFKVEYSYSLHIWGSPPPIQRGDSNLDGRVDVTDLLAVLSDWGECLHCPTDFDGDQSVNVTDLLNVLANWD